MQYVIFLTGLGISMLMATLGAYASRKMKIDYTFMLLLCFVNYFMTGYTAAQFFTISASICFAATLAIVDCTLGNDLSKKIGYYSRVKTREYKGLAFVATNAFIVVVAGIMGMYGAFAAGLPLWR